MPDAKIGQLVTERLESMAREMDKRLDSLEESQSFTSEKYDDVTTTLKNTKKAIKSINDKVEERTSSIEGDVCGNMASLDATHQYLRHDCLNITGIAVFPLDKEIKEIEYIHG